MPNGGDKEGKQLKNMNAYITKSNANRIVKRINLSKVEIEGDIYKEKNRVLNAMFSKYEKHELLAYKKLMEDPEAFMNEIYEKIPQHEDTFWWVYEENNPPAYHSHPTCSRLLSNFKNYKIPTAIRFKGIHRDKNIETISLKELNEEEILKVKTNVINYRGWWNTEGREYYIKDKAVFLMHVNNKYQPEPRIRDITEFEIRNSGIEDMNNNDLKEIENKINQLIKESGAYYHESSQNTIVLQHYARWTNNAYGNKPFPSNDTGYTDKEIREILKDYDKRFKFPLKIYLKEYYRRKNNPELKMDQKILEELGFVACLACRNQEHEQNKDPQSLRGVSTPVADDLLDGIDYESDEALEIMLKADEYNDIAFWEDLNRY